VGQLGYGIVVTLLHYSATLLIFSQVYVVKSFLLLRGDLFNCCTDKGSSGELSLFYLIVSRDSFSLAYLLLR